MGNPQRWQLISVLVSRSRSLVASLRVIPQDVVVSVGHATRCSGDQAPITPSRVPFKREVEVPTQSVYPLSTTTLYSLCVLSTSQYSLSLHSFVLSLYSSVLLRIPPLLPLYAPSTPLSLFGDQSVPKAPCTAL